MKQVSHCLQLLNLMVFVVMLAGCAVNPVTGEQQLMLLSEQDEVQMGLQSDKSILDQYGLYEAPGLQRYLQGIGQPMARISHRPTLNWQFKVMDSPVVNAFAAPGGYIYVTRGLLAATNNEAELAGVLGHEIGHVTARHSAQKYSKMMLANLGLSLGQSLMGDYGGLFGQAMGAGAGLLFLKFSRDDEREADALGVEYAARAGYDASRIADFFTTLQRQASANGKTGSSLPEFFSTHPSPVNREASVRTMAGNWQAKLANRTLRVERGDYLKQIDGMIYGEDPRKGFREDDWYYLPQYQVKLPIQSGWKFAREGNNLQAKAPGGKAVSLVTIYPGGNADRVAAEFVQSSGADVQQNQAVSRSGMTGKKLVSVIKDGKQSAVVVSHFFQKGSDCFGFHGISEAAAYKDVSTQVEFPATGFAIMTDRARLNPQPQRIAVKSVVRSGTMEQALQRLKVKPALWGKVTWLNGRRLTDIVAAGEDLKVIE